MTHFQEADKYAAQLPYIFTLEAKRAKQRQVLQSLLAGLRGGK